MITPNAGKRARSARVARWARPSGFQASAPSRDFFSLGVTGNSANAGIPNSTHSCAASSSKSIDRRSTPGMDGTCSRRLSPSSTNTGRIRSSTVRVCSRTRRREKSSRRLRRRRVAGNRRLAGVKLTADS
ncbi:hypothetical protein D3C80_1597880 [compost metagenome]